MLTFIQFHYIYIYNRSIQHIFDFQRSTVFLKEVKAVKINGGIEGGKNLNDVAKTFDVYKTDVEGVKLIEFDIFYRKISHRTKYYLRLKQCQFSGLKSKDRKQRIATLDRRSSRRKNPLKLRTLPRRLELPLPRLPRALPLIGRRN